MRKTVLIIAMVAMLVGMTSCTGNQRARRYGGDYTITLEPGQKLIEATWKGDNLWYLTAPMEEGYQPVTKTFHEDSNYGCLEGTVYFVESAGK